MSDNNQTQVQESDSQKEKKVDSPNIDTQEINLDKKDKDEKKDEEISELNDQTEKNKNNENNLIQKQKEEDNGSKIDNKENLIENGNNDQISKESLPKEKDEQKVSEKKEDSEIKVVNSEYFNEHNIPRYNDIVDYENSLKAEIERTTPLISDVKPIQTLIDEYKDSIFANSIQEITKKYQFIRYARRDGNCFYRSFIFRLFEHCCINNDKQTHSDVLSNIQKSKDILEFNGFQWLAIEDFYDVFVNEFKLIMTLNNCDKKPYLDLLFSDQNKCCYMIAFVRTYISAYIKENRLLYENFIYDEDLDSWCRREVEPIDVECDNLQIIAITNCFNVGVLIESLGEKKIGSMKLPEEGCSKYFCHLFFRPGHYDILYNN
jgi:ubiquitin thioesterase protein OTUB1